MQIPAVEHEQEVLRARHRGQDRAHVHGHLREDLDVDARVAPVRRLPRELQVVQPRQRGRDDKEAQGEHGDDGDFGADGHAEFPEEHGGEEDVGCFEQGAEGGDEEPGGVDVDAAGVGAGFPGLGEGALEEDDGCRGEGPEGRGGRDEVGWPGLRGQVRDADEEEGDAEDGEGGGVDVGEGREPAEDALGF